MRIVGRLRVGAIMPCIAVAGSDSLNASGAVVEGEVECDGAVAADGIES